MPGVSCRPDRQWVGDSVVDQRAACGMSATNQSQVRPFLQDRSYISMCAVCILQGRVSIYSQYAVSSQPPTITTRMFSMGGPGRPAPIFASSPLHRQSPLRHGRAVVAVLAVAPRETTSGGKVSAQWSVGQWCVRRRCKQYASTTHRPSTHSPTRYHMTAGDDGPW